MVSYKKVTKNDRCHIHERLVSMLKDVMPFLRTIYNYIQSYDGHIQDVYKRPLPAPLIDELRRIAPRLMGRKKANTYLFYVFEPIQYIYILLDGTCCSEKYNHDGQIFTDSTRDALQIFSMMEAVTNQRNHTVSMKCLTDCVYAKIPVSQYMQAVQEDPELMMMSVQLMCVFFLEHLQNTDRLILNSPRLSILSKLHQYCADHTFPVIVQIKKEELAQDLHMNLRTLYRHLDRLYEDRILSSHKGKISITYEQFQLIEAELYDPDA